MHVHFPLSYTHFVTRGNMIQKVFVNVLFFHIMNNVINVINTQFIEKLLWHFSHFNFNVLIIELDTFVVVIDEDSIADFTISYCSSKVLLIKLFSVKFNLLHLVSLNLVFFVNSLKVEINNNSFYLFCSYKECEKRWLFLLGCCTHQPIMVHIDSNCRWKQTSRWE